MEMGRAWHVPRPLNLKAVRQAARLFVGKHDFASFTSNPGYERESTIRRLRAVRITRKPGSVLEFTFDGDGFLYRMVRNLVGALVKVGHGRLSVADLRKILAARARYTPVFPPLAGAIEANMAWNDPSIGIWRYRIFSLFANASASFTLPSLENRLGIATPNTLSSIMHPSGLI